MNFFPCYDVGEMVSMKPKKRYDGCGRRIPKDEKGRWAYVGEDRENLRFLCTLCYETGTPEEHASQS